MHTYLCTWDGGAAKSVPCVHFSPNRESALAAFLLFRFLFSIAPAFALVADLSRLAAGDLLRLMNPCCTQLNSQEILQRKSKQAMKTSSGEFVPSRRSLTPTAFTQRAFIAEMSFQTMKKTDETERKR